MIDAVRELTFSLVLVADVCQTGLEQLQEFGKEHFTATRGIQLLLATVEGQLVGGHRHSTCTRNPPVCSHEILSHHHTSNAHDMLHLIVSSESKNLTTVL